MPEIMPLYFLDAAEWRKWLSANSQQASEAWVIQLKAKSALPGLRYPEALEEALSFGWIDGKVKSIDVDKFMLRYSPRKANSIWSKQNREKAEELIRLDRMAGPGLSAIQAAKDSGNWSKAYTDRIAEALPYDLREALSLKKTANANFKRFSVSSRNMYIRWVNQAKTAQTRLRRITEVVKIAEANLKPGA